MSEYIKTEWKNGDVITAEKLNHIEDGIANAGGGSKIIELSGIEPQEIEQGEFYPYTEGLTDVDLAGSYIMVRDSKHGTIVQLIMAAAPTWTDSDDDDKEIKYIDLTLLKVAGAPGGPRVVTADTALTYYPSSHNDYSKSGFLLHGEPA